MIKRLFYWVGIPILVFLGLVSEAQISGTVYRDYNGNGTRQTTGVTVEPGVEGVIVNAYDANNVLVNSTTSGSNGNYILAYSVPVRIEFELPSSGNCIKASMDYTGFSGDGNNVRFVTGNVSNLNYAVHYPDDYVATTDPFVFTSEFVNGDPLLGSGTATTTTAFRAHPYSNSGTTAASKTLTAPNIGSTYGVAYSKQAKKVFTAAFLKRHAGMGPMGSGGIYLLTPTATSFTVSQFYNMDANGFATRTNSPAYGAGSSYNTTVNQATYIGTIDPVNGKPLGFGVIGSNAQRGLSVNIGVDNNDPAVFDQVCKLGLGDLDISDDGKFLFVMNLYDKKVYRLELNDAYNPTSVVNVTSYVLPTVTVNNGELRPFGLGFERGNLFVGGVASGENGGVNNVGGTTDLYAFVFKLENATGAASFNASPVLNFPLNYAKGPSVLNGAASKKWYPWSKNTSNLFNISGESTYPTPLLSDIEFTDNGDMVLDFMDRSGHQYGYQNYKDLSGVVPIFSYDIGGDLLIAGKNCGTDGFTLELNGAYNSANGFNYSSGASNNQGVGNSEFFKGDFFSDGVNLWHSETSLGSCAVLPGSLNILATAMDPVLDFSSGTGKHSTTNGALNGTYQCIRIGEGFGKAGGLGDIELAGEEPPLEVGNLVWLDTDGDGIQDPTETGIGSVSVELYLGSTLVGQTSTNTNGNYYFNKANVNLNGANGLLPNTTYEVRIDGSQTALTGKILTITDADPAANGDMHDNDGSGSGTAIVSFTTGKFGQNNHSYDFGFSPSCILPTVSAASTACAGTCMNLTGSNPTTGTWSALSGNPSGATVGSTTTGVAQVCFSNTANGSYSFVYNIGGLCEDTVTVNVFPITSSTTNQTVCSNTLPFVWNGNNYNATGTYTFTTTNSNGCDSIATLNLTVNSVSSSTTSASACSNNLPYVWNGNNYSTSGTYTFTTTNSVGCDSVATLVFTVIPTTSSTTAMTVCSNTLPFVWNGNNYNATGTYTFTTTNANGCDSVATLNLTVNSVSSSSTSASACSNNLPYVWNGNNYSTSGTYTFTTTNSVGCDSVATLVFTVIPTTSSTTAMTVCSNTLPFVWNGNNYNATGTYTYTTTNANGCDSVATLNLTVNSISSSSTAVAVCDNTLPYTWNGNNYNTTGTYTFTTTNALGCDSTATLNFTVLATTSSSLNAEVCDNNLPYVWNGSNYNTTGSYTFTSPNSNGCDSVATLNLLVKATSSSTTNVTICANTLPYVWNGSNYSATGSYTFVTPNAVGCDSTATLNLTVTPFGTIGNYVWNDVNNNCLQDDGASNGMNGILVELYKETTAGSGIYVIDQSTTTADNAGNPGYYEFEVCSSANYKLKFPTQVGALNLTTSNNTAATDGNSDATFSTGETPVFAIDVNGSGVNKDNNTLDAGYKLPAPSITAYPNKQYCLGTNVELIAFGAPGATFNWITPSGFTGTIDNSVSGQSKITILNLTSPNNGDYIVTQSLGVNTSTPDTSTIDAGLKASFDYVATACVSNMGQVTIDVTPNTNMEYSINGGAYQSSNVFTVDPGKSFVVSAKPIGSSCAIYHNGFCTYCPSAPNCATPPKDSIAVPDMLCPVNGIAIENYFFDANSVTFTTSGTGTFDNTSCSSSPCTVNYTPSAEDMEKGNVIITATTDDPDGAGSCLAATCSKNIILLNGLVAPTVTTNSPVCENSALYISQNSNVGKVLWNGAGGFTSTANPDTLTATPSTMQGALTATLSALGCSNVTSPAANVTVIAAPNLSVTVTPNHEQCAGQGNGSIEVTVAGGSGAYQICYNSNLSACVNGTYANFQYVAAGNYTVTVIDQACPANIFTYPVTINSGAVVAPPVVASTIDICAGDDLVLSGTSTGTINWTFAGNSFNALGNTVIRYDAQPYMSGVYTAKTFSATGCASIGVPVIVTIGDAPVITHVQVNCLGSYSHIDITATSADPMSYSFGGSNYQSSNIFDSIAGGNYTIYVKNTVTNCITSLMVHIPNCACPNEPVINVVHELNSCGLTPIPLTANFTNASSATWSTAGTGNFNTTSGASPLVNTYTPSSTDLSNGGVDLTITTVDPDGTGPCTPVSKLIHINLMNSLPTPSITGNQASYCTGDTVILSANVGVPVHWTGTGGFVSDSMVAYVPITTPFVSGPYTATITGNGCTTTSDTYNLTVAAAPNLTVTTSAVNESCAGHGNGEITVTVSGGSGTYKICNDFELNCNNTASPYTFKYLAPATYQIHVSDATCPNARTVVPTTVTAGLVVPPPISATYNNPLCAGDDLILTATGNNTLPFEWTDKTNSFVAQGAVVTRTDAQAAMSGKYKVVQLDNGCASLPVELDVMVYDMPEIMAIDTLCAGGSDSGRITITASIAPGQQLEYALNDGAYQSSNVFDFLPNGLYQIRVRAAGSTNCEVMMTGVELYCSCNCNRDAVVSIYPSPNKGSFTVNAELEIQSEYLQFDLYDFAGKRVYHEELEEKTHLLNHKIDIQHLAAGNYMLKVTVDMDSFIVPVSITEK